MPLKPRFPTSDEQLKEFNPNNAVLWATFIPWRGGANKFKVHSSRAVALSAFTASRCASLWEFGSGQWWLRAEKFADARPTHCTHCGALTLVYNPGTQRTINLGAYKFKKEGSRTTDSLELIFLCESCYGYLP